jgi:hypothetical protein
MFLELVKFRRPYSIAISNSGIVACLIRPTTSKIVVIPPSGKNNTLSININNIGLKGAQSLAINHKDELIILDHINRMLFWFDQNLKFISSLRLPGKKYGTMKFCTQTNQIYISVLDQSKVITVDSDISEEFSTLFSYSNIDSISSIDGLALLERNKFLIIDKELSSLFIVSLDKKEMSIKKFLEYGRNGFGKIRHPTDVNVVGELIAVHDNDNYLIQFYDHNIKFVHQVGGKGEDIGNFDLPVSGFTLNDDLFVCDQNNDRIVKLNALNNFKCEVIVTDKFVKGLLSRPSGVSFYKDLLFIADRSNGVIQVFDKDCEYLYVLNIEDKILNRPSSISIIKTHHKEIAVIIERRRGSNCLLNFYTLSADLKSARYINTIDSEYSMNDPQDMDSDHLSSIYIADTLNRRIIKINVDGQLISQVDMAKISNNTRILVKSVSVREDGDIFTADFDKCIVYHLDSSLNLKNKIDFSQYKKNIKVIRSICALENSLILCVRGKNQVLKAVYSGEIISTLTLKNVDWRNPVKISKTSNDKLYISDKENDRVVKIESMNIN